MRTDSYVRAQRISSAGVKEDRRSERRTRARPWLRVKTERFQQVLQGIRSGGTGQPGGSINERAQQRSDMMMYFDVPALMFGGSAAARSSRASVASSTVEVSCL